MKNNRYFNLFRNTAIFLFSGLIIFYLADYGFNGVIREWFYSRFYIEPYPTEEGRIGTLFLQWSEIKSFLVYSFVFFFLFIALIMMTALMLQARAQRKREISMMIRLLDAITGDEEMSSLPEGFGEVETRHMKIRNDISRQKQLAETEMQRKSDLITYLAHDLKTPLASIIGYCSILDEAKDMPDAQKEKYVRIALEKAYRLEDLINEFFEITRFNLHTLVLNHERIKLSYMLEQMVEEFYPMVTPMDKRISLNVSEELMLTGDRDKLARVFNNILKNAISYSSPHTVIDVTAKEYDDVIQISFTNRGNPIPTHKLETIFEKFYRLDSSRSTSSGGSGLGLAIAKEIITAHGGQIEVESTDEKTVFTVRIPS